MNFYCLQVYDETKRSFFLWRKEKAVFGQIITPVTYWVIAPVLMFWYSYNRYCFHIPFLWVLYQMELIANYYLAFFLWGFIFAAELNILEIYKYSVGDSFALWNIDPNYRSKLKTYNLCRFFVYLSFHAVIICTVWNILLSLGILLWVNILKLKNYLLRVQKTSIFLCV